MGRPSKFSETRIAQIKEAILNGETHRSVAKRFKCSVGLVSGIVSERVKEMKSAAILLAESKSLLNKFDDNEQRTITRYAEDLLIISDNLAEASKRGSATSARLQNIAERQSRKIETRMDVDGKETIVIDGEALKMTMALTQIANEAARTPLNLISANKEAIKDINLKQIEEDTADIIIPSDPVEASKSYQRMIKG